MTEKIMIHYNLELDDWVNFSRYHSQNLSCNKSVFRIAWLGFPTIFFIFALIGIFSEISNSISVFLIILSILWLVLIPSIDEYLSRNTIKRMLVKEDRGFWLGPQELTLTPEYILGKNEAGEGKYKWKTVSRIDVIDEYIFIYVTAISAIVIPRRTVIEKDSFDETARFAKEYWQMSEHY